MARAGARLLRAGGADDVFSGGEIRAHIWDGDNDQVQAIWHATNPRIIIVRGNDRIEAIDFPLGEPLTIEVDDPAFDGIEFSETGIVGTNPAKPWETLLVFDLGRLHRARRGDSDGPRRSGHATGRAPR